MAEHTRRVPKALRALKLEQMVEVMADCRGNRVLRLA